ncbi:hypothetical protein FN846DRAFT_886244 [Sphaerosporella brunnea]|uniref:Uncharacterized protein n=1 Tax=Sphaerosporella brunnea TaxID=1250544 RepID=A0A5J5F9P4_9PEZI|nr:hypothetical protein FN846DRAFT_886244 [Sphaerosporella brunnea]
MAKTAGLTDSSAERGWSVSVNTAAVLGYYHLALALSAVNLSINLETRLNNRIDNLETGLNERADQVNTVKADVADIKDHQMRTNGQLAMMENHMYARKFIEEELPHLNTKGCLEVQATPRSAAFRIDSEKRDRAFILTGANDHPPYVGKRKEMLCGPAIEAAHIIPLGRSDLWKPQSGLDTRW